jgi:hypothetical protein
MDGWGAAGSHPARRSWNDQKQGHLLAATRALGLGRLQRRWLGRGLGAEDLVQAGELLLRRRTQEPIVPYAHESFGQHVQAPPTQELLHAEGDAVPTPGLTVLAVEPDVTSCIITQQARLAHGGLVDIAREITHRGLATPDGPHIDDPWLAPHHTVERGEVPGLFLPVADLEEPAHAVAERRAEGLDGKEVTLPLGPPHPQAIRAQREAGQDDVQVGMILHLPRPGVEHGAKAGRAAEVPGILGEVLEG